MTEEIPKRFKVHYLAIVDGFKQSDVEYRVALNKNLLQFVKTEVEGNNPLEEEEDIPENCLVRKLELDMTNKDDLDMYIALLGEDAHLIEDFDWEGQVRLYFNRNTKTEIFKIPHISDINKEFCMAVFSIEQEQVFNNQEKWAMKVTETYCDKTTSFVGQIASSYMKMDLEQSTLGDLKK